MPVLVTTYLLSAGVAAVVKEQAKRDSETDRSKPPFQAFRYFVGVGGGWWTVIR